MRTLEQIKSDYAIQDNRGTAYPFYVSVQELHCVGVMADGYSPNCPYGDSELKTEYKHPNLEGTYDSVQEIMKTMHEEGYITLGEEEEIEELNVGYIWVDVEMFLTIKGAEEYIKSNAHNHGKLRTYVKWFETRNFEMRTLLNEIGFSHD